MGNERLKIQETTMSQHIFIGTNPSWLDAVPGAITRIMTAQDLTRPWMRLLRRVRPPRSRGMRAGELLAANRHGSDFS